MREILFRGKRIDNGEWIEGFFAKARGKSDIVRNKHRTGVLYFIDEVDPSTVGQYTGLCDKNGKKIFEGDIGKNIDGVFCVRWSNEKCAFVMDLFDYPREELYLEEMWDDTEVIGNIHDNPELLED